MSVTREAMGGSVAAVLAALLAASGACSGTSDTGNGGFSSGSTTNGTGAGKATGSGGGSGQGGGTFCSGSNDFKCEGDTAVPCESSSGAGKVDCKAKGKVCADGLGCVVCVPGGGTCKDGQATTCKADGSAEVSFTCDPVQGMQCTSSGCKGSCSPGELGPSYLGCDYFPTVTLNPVWSGFDFAVAVGNASKKTAHITVTQGSKMISTATVAANDLSIIKLPWVTDLKGGDVDACQIPPEPGVTRLVKSGAYRVRTDQPVTVYQLSPLEYELVPPPAGCPVPSDCPGSPNMDKSCKSYSNDASLLLPSTALTGDYDTLTWPSTGDRAGFLAITATSDGTTVVLKGHGQFAAGAGVDANGNGTIKLDTGDVLEVLAEHDQAQNVFGGDISGTLVRASAPVQVVAGQSCANVPKPTTGTCDHIEEALFPDETLGDDYLVTYPAAVGDTSPHVISIAAVQPGTKLTFDPSSVHGDATLGPGDAPLVILDVKKDVHVKATGPIIVAQFMQGSSSVPSMQGDPSMSLAIPSAQFRSDYIFVASTTYDANFVNIMAPAGTSISLDGKVVPQSEFSTIGSSGFSVARHQLGKTDAHHITANVGFGIVVYGYGQYTSYMYPGGLDLKSISSPPPK